MAQALCWWCWGHMSKISLVQNMIPSRERYNPKSWGLQEIFSLAWMQQMSWSIPFRNLLETVSVYSHRYIHYIQHALVSIIFTWKVTEKSISLPQWDPMERLKRCPSWGMCPLPSGVYPGLSSSVSSRSTFPGLVGSPGMSAAPQMPFMDLSFRDLWVPQSYLTASPWDFNNWVFA